MFPPFSGVTAGLPSPEPRLSRGREAADRGSLSVRARPRSCSCQPIWDTGSSWTSPAVCVLGETFVPWLPWESHILLGTLSSVLVVTPEHLRPAGLGGAREDKAAFGCPWPGGQSASAHRPDGDLEVGLVSPSLCHRAHLGFVMTLAWQMLLVNSAAAEAPARCLLPSHRAAAWATSTITPPFPVSQAVGPAPHSQGQPLETRFDHISPGF